MWARIRGGIYLLAALLTIGASAVAIHQYTATDEGRWVVTWASVDTLKLFVILVLLFLPWVAFMKSWFVERDFKAEKKTRDGDYRTWIEERGREISEQCIAEYRSLEQHVSDSAGIGAERINRLVAEHDTRVKALVVSSATRDLTAELVAEGDLLFNSLHQETRGDRPITPSVDPEDRVQDWERKVVEFLQECQPDFIPQFKRPFLHFHKGYNTHYAHDDSGAFMRLQRVRVRTERLTAMLAARPKVVE